MFRLDDAPATGMKHRTKATVNKTDRNFLLIFSPLLCTKVVVIKAHPQRLYCTEQRLLCSYYK